MTLTKNRMVQEIGRRTRLKNREVQVMLEALIEVWAEELIAGGKIELENLFVLETQWIDRGDSGGLLNGKPAPRYIRRLTLRTSRRLRYHLKQIEDDG